MNKTKPLGLHITSDFPGPYSPMSVTVAIRDLVVGVSEVFNSAILVPRRTRKPIRTKIMKIRNELHIGLFDPVAALITNSWQRLDWINLVETNLLSSVRPDFVHSHKLTYEARIGDLLAKHYDIPHIITVRGSSDTHYRNHWPWNAHIYRNILTRSHTNLWLSVWAKPFINKRTGYRPSKKDIDFANAVPVHSLYTTSSRKLKRNALVCICRLDDYEQKGIVALLRGFASARSVIPDLTLDLIGPCGYPARKILDTLISECDLNNSVTWHGPMTRREVIERMSGYAAMILLSKNESFGLVYAEAVLSGIPIVYLRGSGVDGYDFANRYGIACENLSVSSIQTALIELSTRQTALRDTIIADRSSGSIDHLTSDGQAKLYSSVISSALKC
ncbi:MAG: glycosyltransferase [Nitrosomonas sp.]|nr:glycosyltransferase [Nitrosomonas sp.]MCW5607153.1 glycosyltransferase [Nitrosomonas sp.]